MTCQTIWLVITNLYSGMLWLYLMGLNLSNQQIAAELDLNKDDVR